MAGSRGVARPGKEPTLTVEARSEWWRCMPEGKEWGIRMRCGRRALARMPAAWTG